MRYDPGMDIVSEVIAAAKAAKWDRKRLAFEANLTSGTVAVWHSKSSGRGKSISAETLLLLLQRLPGLRVRLRIPVDAQPFVGEETT